MKHLMLVLAAASALSSAAHGADVVIKIGTVVSGDHPENVGAREIKRLIEERSDGAIEVRLFTDSQLGNQRELVEQLRDGTLELTWVTTGFFGSWEPVLNTLEIGYLFDDREHAFRAFDGPLGDEVAQLVDGHGVKLLGWYEAGMRHVTNAVRAIETPDNMRGLKIRTPQAKYHLTTLEMMGASATPMAFNELYSAMEQGIVDGQENPLSNIHSAAFHEVNQHLALTGHLHLTHMVLYSADLWEQLSSDQQEIIQQAVVDSQEAQRNKVAEDDATLLSVLEENGMSVTNPDREAFAALVAPLREQAIEEYGDQAANWIELIEAARQ